MLLLFSFVTPAMLWKVKPPHRVNDFFAFHSFSAFARHYPAGSIYDYRLLHSFQGLPPWSTFPYFYQPLMLLLVSPLAYLPYSIGYVIWMAVGLSGCLFVFCVMEGSAAAMMALLVAPSTLVVAINGQSGLIATALLFGGFSLLERRPVLAGVFFGMLIYKPQLFVLVPVALLAGGRWRTIVVGGVTAMLFILASIVLFGFSVWASWWTHLPMIGATIVAKGVESRFWMATVTSNLLVFGVDLHRAALIQSVASLLAIVAVTFCARRGSPMLTAAAVAVGTFLTTPFAFDYDLVLVTGAVLVLLKERWQEDHVFTFLEVAVLVVAFLMPWCFMSPVLFRFSSAVVAALLCLIVCRVQALSRIAS
ncbi:glycosyltransferase family 87 protein [Lichenicoccus sp.]|uniref:glycosyltransferase family 87 protein n=1 Tax=Lichenicoccus sp. TaxID=2781899 RepID=UPI003D10A316